MRLRRSQDASNDFDDPAEPRDRQPILRPGNIIRLALAVIFLPLGIYNLVKATEGKSTNSSQPPTTQPTNGPTTTGPVTPTTTAVTIYQFSGSGPQASDKFTVPASAPEWDIEWSTDCSAGSTFLVDVTGFGHAAGTADSGVTEIGGPEYQSGYSPNYDHGQFQLTVTTTTCNWDIEVVLPIAHS
jgi:hypothetical protein